MLLIQLGLRNLLRQKRRSILLGIAIAFGMTILVVANSFSHGITDILFNRVIVYMLGHVQVRPVDAKRMGGVIPDKHRMMNYISNNIDYPIDFIEENVMTFGRVRGNGKSDNMPIAGIGTEDKEQFADFLDFIEVESGNIDDFTNKNVENPMLIYENKAENLNVVAGETIKARFRTRNNQMQTATFTVVALLKADNMFMSMAGYAELSSLKKLMDLRPHEAMTLNITLKDLKNPRFAIETADKLHDALEPGRGVIYGTVSAGEKNAKASVLGFETNNVAKSVFMSNATIVAGSFTAATNETNAMIPKMFAESLNLSVGSTVIVTYTPKYGKTNVSYEYVIGAIFDNTDSIPNNVLLVNEKDFYYAFQYDVPKNPEELKKEGAFVPEEGHALWYALSPEWRLLQRTATSEEMMRKMRNVRNKKPTGLSLDVPTMYEGASFVIELESVLNLITLSAVLVLFFIILIGVINTLRMTIRERTREIGTTRAIGMQRGDVLKVFLIETFFLAFFACIAGVILGILVMNVLALFNFYPNGIVSIFLVENSLWFVPKASSIIFYMFLILLITVGTAFFPSRRGARLRVADALRHFE